MDEHTKSEIIRLFSAPYHRPFAEIDKRLGLERGESWKFLEKAGLFERAEFYTGKHFKPFRRNLKLVVDTRK
jgi:hypothetical protein